MSKGNGLVMIALPEDRRPWEVYRLRSTGSNYTVYGLQALVFIVTSVGTIFTNLLLTAGRRKDNRKKSPTEVKDVMKVCTLPLSPFSSVQTS